MLLSLMAARANLCELAWFEPLLALLPLVAGYEEKSFTAELYLKLWVLMKGCGGTPPVAVAAFWLISWPPTLII